MGYFLDGYHLPPVMFTNAEVSALVFGAKRIERMADNSRHYSHPAPVNAITEIIRWANPGNEMLTEAVPGSLQKKRRRENLRQTAEYADR